MLYEKINTLVDNLETAAGGLEAIGDANPGVILAYRVIADMLRRDLAEEDSFFTAVATFTDALGCLSQEEPNVGARTAYTLVAGRLDSILREHA